MEYMAGEIRLMAVAADKLPEGWLPCEGQELDADHFAALFSVLRYTYGGDGKNRFRLPDLRGRVPIGAGAGTGLTPRQLGQTMGHEQNALTERHLPAHHHLIHCNTDAGAGVNTPLHNVPGTGRTNRSTGAPINRRYAPTSSALMKSDVVTTAGAGAPLDNMQPMLVLTYMICVKGDIPPYA